MFNIFKAAVSTVLEQQKADVISRPDVLRYLSALKWASLAYSTNEDSRHGVEKNTQETVELSPSLINAAEVTPHHHCIIDQSGNTDTRIIVEMCPDEDGILHISCRGTVSERDWLTNLHFKMMPFTPLHEPNSSSKSTTCVSDNSTSSSLDGVPLVHTGFYRALESVLPSVLNAVSSAVLAPDALLSENIINSDETSAKQDHFFDETTTQASDTISTTDSGNVVLKGNKLKQINISGHSLGGGLACLLGYTLATNTQLLELLQTIHDDEDNDNENKTDVKRGSIQVQVTTFGAPQVGEQKFAELVATTPNLSNERIVLRNDPVPNLLNQTHQSQYVHRPYVHVPLRSVYLDSSSESIDRIAQSAVQAYQSNNRPPPTSTTTSDDTPSSSSSSRSANSERVGWNALVGVISAAGAAASTIVNDHSLDTYWQHCIQKLQDPRPPSSLSL